MAEENKPQDNNGKVGSVMVVGGGIGGMQASLDLANAGFHVTLVEQGPAIGGHMAQLDKTFPTNDCSMCIISPKLIEVDKHLNINILTNTSVEGISGEAGRFKVRLVRQPRYVDPDKCNACGDCVEVCPIEVGSEFDEMIGPRKAVYKHYPQACPNTYAIDKRGTSPCKFACPTHVSVQGYLALTAQGRFKEALELIKRDNPLPAVCGRVCHHPCEESCTRGSYDDPLAIRAIKRFLADQEPELDLQPPKPETAYGEKVAVIGSGPAGLTAAYFLAIKGYKPTIFEASSVIGGMLWLGIPSYRLPRDVLAAEIEYIERAGVEIRTNAPLGEELNFDSLTEQGYKAFFLATGAHGESRLGIQGEELEGVLSGVDFLRRLNIGEKVKLGQRVAVIGGGNVAVDAVRAALRLGAKQAMILYRRSRDEMPALAEEIKEAEEERIEFSFLVAPTEILGSGGKVSGIRCQKMRLGEPDESGRRRPIPVEASEYDIPVDNVIAAVGQKPQIQYLPYEMAERITSRQRLEADELTFTTGIPGLFAGGDNVTGPATVVEAIAAGKEAAESIHRYLRGMDLRAGREDLLQRFDVSEMEVPWAEPVKQPHRNGSERIGDFDEIWGPLTAEQVVAEARRCLACGVCSECYRCVDACSAGAIIHDEKNLTHELDAGSIILAPGYDKFDAARCGEYGYGRYPNVINSLEFERILSASGPYQGHVLRPSDRTEPKRVAWIQCVGSRDVQLGNDYCSSVCCTYAVKEAIMAVDHVPGLEATIFYNDIRTFGKGFEAYYESAKRQFGVKFRCGIISGVKEKQQTKNLLLCFVDENGEPKEEEFDLVVLSVGLRPSQSAARLVESLGVELDRFGFCQTTTLAPGRTSKDGIYVAGAFAGPMDIPETVMTASAAASLAAEGIQEARGTMIREKAYPAERDTGGEEPRVGVFICRCGTNIARVVGVEGLVDYAKSLPGVVHAEENLYTCSTDTQVKFVEIIREHKLNRVVVASCTPRTHEPLFQETLREAGLNRHLFEMANIRDQCSWVHFSHPEQATFKAKDLVRMAVARATTLRPFDDLRLEVDQRGIVIGAGLAGMTAALALADQGFEVALIERESEPGGIARNIHRILGDGDPQAYLADLIRRTIEHRNVRLYTDATIEEFGGHVGKFRATIRQNNRTIELGGGAVIVATGGAAYQPTEYRYPESESIVTQLELEEKLADPQFAKGLKEVVMIQCVGSREEEHLYCSRVCCQEAVKNALAIKEANPDARVFVLYRDIRTYGAHEVYYQRARDAGVVFMRFDPEQKPEVAVDGGLRVRVVDDVLGRLVELRPDVLALSAAVRPHSETAAVSRALKVPLTADGFFLEAHIKLRPLDFGTEGIFLAGLAHAPKLMSEAISQAQGAAARAATVISQPYLDRSGVISEVDQQSCAACLTCVRMCPYDVPVINEDGVAFIEPASCQGCGVCASACPRKAITTRHYRDEQVTAKVDVLFGDPQFEAEGAAAAEAGEKA